MKKVIKNISLKEIYITLFGCNDKRWNYNMFIIIFVAIVILNLSGIYKLNGNLITAFSIGTLVITFSDIINNREYKRMLYVIGLAICFIVPNCDGIVEWLSKNCPNDIVMLLSIILVFISMVNNLNKEEQLKEQTMKLNVMKGLYNEKVELINNTASSVGRISNSLNERLICQIRFMELYKGRMKEVYDSLDEDNKEKFKNDFNKHYNEPDKLKKEIESLKQYTNYMEKVNFNKIDLEEVAVTLTEVEGTNV